MRSSYVSCVLVGMAAVALVGCGKIAEMIKGSAAAPDAAPSAPVVAAPSAPEPPVAVADAAPAPTAVTTTVKPIVKPKDGGVDAAADASVADAAVADAAVAVAVQKPTRGNFTCDVAGCTCQAGASCDINCPAGAPCNVVVAEIATATIRGTSASLLVTCAKGATCHVRSGAGSSKTRCTGANCDVECRSGACDLTCTGGGKCSVNKKGSGAVKCEGCS